MSECIAPFGSKLEFIFENVINSYRISKWGCLYKDDTLALPLVQYGLVQGWNVAVNLTLQRNVSYKP